MKELVLDEIVFKSESKARKEAERLRKKGYDVVIVKEVIIDKQPKWIVRFDKSDSNMIAFIRLW